MAEKQLAYTWYEENMSLSPYALNPERMDAGPFTPGILQTSVKTCT